MNVIPKVLHQCEPTCDALLSPCSSVPSHPVKLIEAWPHGIEFTSIASWTLLELVLTEVVLQGLE